MVTRGQLIQAPASGTPLDKGLEAEPQVTSYLLRKLAISCDILRYLASSDLSIYILCRLGGNMIPVMLWHALSTEHTLEFAK